MDSDTNQESLSTRELAERWGRTVHTLENWRSMGRGPTFVREGRRVRYPLAEVVSFEEANPRYRRAARAAG